MQGEVVKLNQQRTLVGVALEGRCALRHKPTPRRVSAGFVERTGTLAWHAKKPCVNEFSRSFGNNRVGIPISTDCGCFRPGFFAKSTVWLVADGAAQKSSVMKI